MLFAVVLLCRLKSTKSNRGQESAVAEGQQPLFMVKIKDGTLDIRLKGT